MSQVGPKGEDSPGVHVAVAAGVDCRHIQENGVGPLGVQPSQANLYYREHSPGGREEEVVTALPIGLFFVHKLALFCQFCS